MQITPEGAARIERQDNRQHRVQEEQRDVEARREAPPRSVQGGHEDVATPSAQSSSVHGGMHLTSRQQRQRHHPTIATATTARHPTIATATTARMMKQWNQTTPT